MPLRTSPPFRGNALKPRLEVLYQPRNASQRALAEKWAAAKLVLLVGPAGTGKSCSALAHALLDCLAGRARRLLLCRPAVACDEDLGFLPGDLDEKLGPWLGAFRDVLGDLSHARWEDVLAADRFEVELLAAGMARGRTVKDGVLICDEAQNLTPAQIKCLATRVGRNGKVVLCGDPTQSDLRLAPNPLAAAAARLALVDGVELVKFAAADQLRDPFVTAVIDALQ